MCLWHCVCLFVLGQDMSQGLTLSLHHSDQMSGRQLFFFVCRLVKSLVVWLSQWQGHLLSCFGQLKRRCMSYLGQGHAGTGTGRNPVGGQTASFLPALPWIRWGARYCPWWKALQHTAVEPKGSADQGKRDWTRKVQRGTGFWGEKSSTGQQW